jgi:hypothetical protein
MLGLNEGLAAILKMRILPADELIVWLLLLI